MEMKIFEGKTVEEALENASKELGISVDNIKYEILDEGSKGFFKVFAKKSRIKILNSTDTDSHVEERVEELLEQGLGDLKLSSVVKENNKKDFNDEEIIEFVKEFLTDFFKFFNIDIRFDYRHYKTKVNVLIFTQGDFIETNNFEEFIYSIKYLLNKIVGKKFKTNLKFEVDINEYIKKKIMKLRQIAKEVSERVKIEQRSIKLRPMYPNERRVVHVTLKNDREIKTESIGHGDKKQVVISPVKH